MLPVQEVAAVWQSAQARDEAFPAYELVMNKIGRERGWGPFTRQAYDAMLGPQGALFVGSVVLFPDGIVGAVSRGVQKLRRMRESSAAAADAPPSAPRRETSPPSPWK